MSYGLNRDDSTSTEHAAYCAQRAHEMIQVASRCSSRGTAKKVIGEAILQMEEAMRSLQIVLKRGRRNAD